MTYTPTDGAPFYLAVQLIADNERPENNAGWRKQH